ncbi:Thioesterase-like superfamily protein [Frankia sp. EI5c]|uniref:thioesterase family protein n=1 Tax=Frankia sp. EI5c TaxID=683316 RepID=UPI0007C21D0D|nr:thioesterase family protein [Frankia sp. EI5c]OAA23893.1 Thioesterase-like superfamily protein [Frankia sp. EI5c]
MYVPDTAFFLPAEHPASDGDGAAVLRAMPTCHGSWSTQQQHGGVTSAVLTWVLERAARSAGLTDGHLARIAVEFLRPAPVGEIRLRASVVRPGRRVALLRAEMGDGAQTFSTAQAWWRRRASGVVPGSARDDVEPLVAPGEVPAAGPDSDLARLLLRGYMAAVDWRPVTGHLDRPGPCTVWARPRIQLIAGEPISPTQLAMLVTDAGSAVSAVLDFRSRLFSNIDLVVSLLREPAGEWISMRAETMIDDAGGGTTTTVLGDEKGPFGASLHTLFVAPHDSPTA